MPPKTHQVSTQKSRSEATKTSLMLAAEKLIAEKGLKGVSIKEIVQAANQKNESALQYHFKSLQGLIDAILEVRSEQIKAKRAQLLADLNVDSVIELRDVCKLMVLPAFLLGRRSAEFRRFIVGFSHDLALSPNSLLAASRHGGSGESGKVVAEMLLTCLPHLSKRALQERFQAAVRLASISIGHHARQKNAFRGVAADLFISHLVDAMVGLLGAPTSDETHELEQQI